jgi:hypothetical protein
MGTPRDLDARKFYRVARQRLEEAKLIAEKLQLWAASEYLAGYAVECALKALVILVTPGNERPKPGDATVNWLKVTFGHGLNAMRRYLTGRGARMPRDMGTDFLFVSTWDPQQRYEPGPGEAERTERFLAAADSVVKWAGGRMT